MNRRSFLCFSLLAPVAAVVPKVQPKPVALTTELVPVNRYDLLHPRQINQLVDGLNEVKAALKSQGIVK